ncbi:MAG TPA: serine/threonine-protein kinase [Pseudonocardia sp.]
MNAAPTPAVPGLENPEAIGRGGFGTVYVAEEPAFGRRVAVKILSQRIGDDKARRSFERECQAMGALSGHPHIVGVHRGGATERGEPYIVMDYLAGGSLADRVAQSGSLPWFEALDIAVLVAGALETAHRSGILHLDVKPANVLMSRFAEPVLGDFGISRLPGLTVTLDGKVRATATYSAPERLIGGDASVHTDLYALGATLFALLAGAPAFSGKPDDDVGTTIARVLRDPVPDLRLRGIPGPVADVVERLMAKDPAGRPASALDAAAELQAAQRATGQPVTRPVVEGRPALDAASSPTVPTVVRGGWTPYPIPTQAPARRGPRWLVPGAVAALVVVLAVAATLLYLHRAGPSPAAVATPNIGPTSTATAAASTEAASTTAASATASAVAIAPGITHPATADVARVLDNYIAGIDEHRYADAFALFSADNPTARKGVAAWEAAESTTQISGARLVSVRSGTAGSVAADMTFTSTQDARFGFQGQTCSRWDLVYTMAGPGPNWLIRRATARTDPKAC